MYMGRLCAFRRSLVTAIGGYRASVPGALDYDLALRAAAAARRIVHVPDVLYHRHIASDENTGILTLREILGD